MSDLDRQIAKKLSFDWPEYGTPFSPSSRIDHAWLVVEEMERRGYRAIRVWFDVSPAWAFQGPERGRARQTIWAGNDPESICYAALEALKNDN